MTDRTAIRTGLLLNAALFLVACIVVDLMPVHMGPGGFFALAALGVAAGSYAAQDAAEDLVAKAWQVAQLGGSGLAVDEANRSADQVRQVAAGLAIVSWALGLLAFVNLAVSAL